MEPSLPKPEFEQAHITEHLERVGYVHAKTLIEAFAVGVLSADPYYTSYQVPPNFEKVMNHISKRVTSFFNPNEVLQFTLRNVEHYLKLWAEEMPEYLAWNEEPGFTDAVRFVDRYTPVSTKREFISLDAVIRNASVHIRNGWDRDAESDRRFEAKYGKKS